MSAVSRLPVVDVAALSGGDAAATVAAEEIAAACRDAGFFYVVGHGVEPRLLARLDQLARAFFALPLEDKMALRMELGGPAWRGYFPVGDELTAGKPDQKEGLYFGAELPADHPAVVAGTPLHGPNLFPPIDGFREVVLGVLDAMTGLGHRLMEGIALSLGLPRHHFRERLTRDPLILFRIFHYPPLAREQAAELWSVGEHTDYGLLTILLQDDSGGLQVKAGGEWIDAPPLPGSFVCNLGDMLERMTGGRYRSTPHRVRNTSGRSRLSFPFFFDPGWDAEVEPVPGVGGGDLADGASERWDGEDPHLFVGTYGDYLIAKIGKVFPELGGSVLQRRAAGGASADRTREGGSDDREEPGVGGAGAVHEADPQLGDP